MTANIKKINEEHINNIAGGQYEDGEGYLFKHYGAALYNNYIDEGVTPSDVIHDHLSESQVAEYEDVVANGTSSRYYTAL